LTVAVAARVRRLVNRFAQWRRRRVRAGGRQPLWHVVGITLACLSILGLQARSELGARAGQVQEIENSLATLASSLTQQAEDTIEIADTALVGVVQQVESAGTSPEALARLDRMLAARAATRPRFRDIAVLGADGNWLATSLPAKGVNLAQRAYFRHHRDEADRGPFLGPPIRSVVTGEWILTVSRRFDNADGSFGGIVAAAIDLSYFLDLYATYDLGHDGAIWLATTDGILLARYPAVRQFAGEDISRTKAFAQMAGHRAGSFENISYVDGTMRFSGYRRSDRHKLVGGASMSQDAALAGWRRQALLDMAATLLLVGAVWVLAWYLTRLTWRSQQAARDLRKTQDLLDRTGRLAGVGGWEVDLATEEIYWSPETCRLHGVPSGHRPTLAEAVGFYAPEARATIATAMAQADRDGSDWDLELPFNGAPGGPRWVRAMGTMVIEEGKPVRAVGALQDITESVARRQALRDVGTRMALATDSGGIGIWDWELASDMLTWDACMHRLYGMPPTDARLTHATWTQYLHPDDRLATEAALSDGVAGIKPYDVEFRIVWDDGSVHHMRGASQPTHDATGRVVGMVGTNWCVTEARRATTELARQAAELSESEERYRLLLQSDIVSEAIYLLDPDGIVQSWSAGAERIKGYTAAEIIGQSFAVFFTPEDAALGAPAQALATARDKGRYTTEAWRVRKGGGQFLARISIDVVRRTDGTLRGFAKVTRDITQERIEEEQRAIIVEAAPNGMMIVDEAGIVTLANAKVERIFGHEAGTLRGQPLEILAPEGFRAAHGTLRTAFAGGHSDQAMEFAGRKRDGEPVTIDVMLNPIKTPRGRIVVASLYDVTDRARLAGELRQAEERERIATAATNARLEALSKELATACDLADQASEAKSRFLAGMSHELRTPLNGIIGYAQLLRMDGDLNPLQSERVGNMLGAGRHLLQMIEGVLDVSEIEASRTALEISDADLAQIAGACLDIVRPMALAKGLALGLAIAADVPHRVRTDATRLRQVLLNLLGNAIKFTARGSVDLRVGTAGDGGVLRIAVADTGPGIPAAKQGLLFQRFERLETDGSRTVEGAGLGLSLSAQLAGLLGGRVGHADNPDGGSVFWLEIPLHPVVPAGPTGAHVATAPDAAPVTGLRLLLVDDVAMNRDIAGAMLCAAGHSVACAENGEEAVAAAAAHVFDVVLMDVRMPVMDGLEATRRIRLLPEPYGRVPVLGLTAQAFADQIAKCREAGMNDHIAKPFEQAALVAAVAALAASATEFATI
jgi:PAS domain S-box-containing protein